MRYGLGYRLAGHLQYHILMPAGAGVSARIHHTSRAVLHGLTGHELTMGDAKLIDLIHLYVDKKKGNGRTNFSPSFACMQT